jgi:hypothetical protein
MIDVKNLTKSDIETFIYKAEGWLCDEIESINLINCDPDKYAAAYFVNFGNDKQPVNVFFAYKSNGDLISSLGFI